MLDDTSMFHQQQLNPQELAIVNELNAKLSAMPDDEFFALLASIDNKTEENKSC